MARSDSSFVRRAGGSGSPVRLRSSCGRCLVAVALAAAIAPSASSQVRGATRTLGVDDLLALKTVSEPDVSPDGDWIAYTVERNVIEDDEATSQIFMVSSEGGEVVQLTSDDYAATTPRWSPDGRYLAFLAAKGDEETTQVWTLDRRGGDAQPYTDVDQGVRDFRWSPDGRRMALVIKDKTPADVAAEAAEADGMEPRPLPYVIDRLQFKTDGVDYLDRSRAHVYVADGRGADPVQLTFGDYDDADPVWSPSGAEIAFVSNRTEEPDANENTDIWIVPAAARGGEPPLRRITRNPGADYEPAFSRDGRWLAYVTVTQPELIWYATNHLAVASADGGQERVLTAALDRNVAAPRFTADDAAIVFLLEDSAEVHVAYFDFEAGRLAGDESGARGSVFRPIESGTVVEDYAQHPSGDVVALMGRPDLPDELFRLPARNVGGARGAPAAGAAAPVQLTRTNEAVLDGLALGEVANVTFPSADGTEIEGFIFTPPDYRRGREYPTILRIHGGPVWRYDFSFNAEARLLAAHGYVVVTSNPRGSSGYGQDFSLAIFAEWGVKDFEDVNAAVDYAIEQGYSDPDRLGVGGWSYGGILTNYVITKTDRFEAAITGASEVNYLANYGHDQYQLEWEAELGLPWENRDAWDAISPWNDVDKIVTPTLVMGGKQDWNVPIQNSEQLYQALRRRGVPTQLVVYPDEAHSITRPSFVKDRLERYVDWYDTYVRGR